MAFKKIICVTGICLVMASFGAKAALYNMTAVLNSPNDGGFGFSGFHFAGEDPGSSNSRDHDGKADTGSSLADIIGLVSGSYDTSGGLFNAIFTLDDSSTVTLSGSGINFDVGTGLLVGSGSIDLAFSSAPPGLNDATINFAPGYVCCGNNNFDPNSFLDNGSVKWMSLWGSDDSDGYSEIGLDLRIELTAVPVPAAVWLFGSGLIGLVGVARRKV